MAKREDDKAADNDADRPGDEVPHVHTPLELSEHLHMLQRRLAEAQRRAEVGQRDRKLLAYEIHDGLLQDITAAAMFLDVADVEWSKDLNESRANLRRALELIRAAAAEARRLVGGLQLPLLESAGLAEALESLVDEYRQRSTIALDAQIDVHSQHLVSTLETAALRVLQEALTNAERHSGAQRICVRVVERDTSIEIMVEDDGVGFDARSVPADRFGVRGIRERAELVGGKASIDSAPGRGTKVHVQLPLSDHLLTPL